MIIRHAFRISKKLSRAYLYECVAKNFLRIPPNSKVLCIGADGGITSLIKRYGSTQDWQLITADINPSLKPDLCIDLCKHTLEVDSFDAILCYEILEHLYSPDAAIINIYNALKDGGMLFGSVPFVIPIHEAPFDFYRFTSYGVEKLLSLFSESSVLPRGSYYEAILSLLARAMFSSGGKMTAPVLYVYIAYYFLRPLFLLLNKIAPLEGLSIGYTFSARKAKP